MFRRLPFHLLRAEKGPLPRAATNGTGDVCMQATVFIGKATSAVSRNAQHKLSQPEASHPPFSYRHGKN